MQLSVIIPTRNRAKLLKKTLKSIYKQTLLQKQFEVIVIDNGSTDKTKDVVDSLFSNFDSLSYFYDSTPGLHVGRHRGLKEAKSDILVYCDDDIEAFPSWLETILQVFEDESVGLVGGKNLPNFESKPPVWLDEMWNKNTILGILSIIDQGDTVYEIEPTYIWGCNFSIRKSLLLESGGFHPDAMPQELIKYRGDGETAVSDFIKNSSYKAIYHPSASVYHFVPSNRMTEKYFCKRMYNQGVSDSYTKLREYGNFSDLDDRESKKIKNPKSLNDKMQNAYLNGYIYHQTECVNDINLMNWVLKENYYV